MNNDISKPFQARMLFQVIAEVLSYKEPAVRINANREHIGRNADWDNAECGWTRLEREVSRVPKTFSAIIAPECELRS
jgi:hypothetical protein